MDLAEAAHVAVKVHQLAPHWGEDKKRNYVKHALREYEIQRGLAHPNVVRLHAVIEIDADAFATVLEYCPGGDLEKVLKASGSVPEREARCVVLQVLAALRYLNGYASPWLEEGTDAAGTAAEPTVVTAAATPTVGPDVGVGGRAAEQSPVGGGGSGVHRRAAASNAGSDAAAGGGEAPQRRKIIHYDLKPANILFDEFRNVKVTDFGLSKIMDEGDGPGGDPTSMELTSQGAGTYWYLPPECFAVGGSAVRISNKVDVWSVGVIFYQMLFGRRPFGEGMTQEQMLAAGTMTQQTAGGPTFPAKPAVSAEAKAFIKRCLQHSVALRPDVLSACEDPYLRMKMK